MEISVKNFGPIKYGSIDLSKRFYVFVGHNNSGKTYMANLVWSAIASSYNTRFSNLDNPKSTEKSLFPTYKINKESYKIHNDLVIKATELHLENIKEKFYKNLRIENNDLLFNHVYFSLFIPLKNLKSRKIVVFLTKKDSETKVFKVFFNENSLEFDFKHDAAYVVNVDINLIEEYYRKENFEHFLEIDGDINMQDLLNSVTSMILEDIFFSTWLNFNMIFLPANRLFYPSFYRYVYEAAKDDNDKIGEEIRKGKPNIEKIKSLSKRPYTQAMDDLLEKIYWLKGNEKPNENYTDLLLKLRKLIGGEIVTKNAEGIGLNEFKLKMDSGEELDLYLSSSAANQLTTLYLYLKYWVSNSNNFLIMDEPEENLHPKHQIALLDILMQFANRNDNRVLITTHSSLLAESVNNHIQIGKLQDLGEDVERIVRENDLDISLNENLRPDDFGIYFFGNQTITPYEVDDYGVFFRDFKQEEDKVASIAEVLTDRIYNLKKAQKNEIETDRTVGVSQ